MKKKILVSIAVIAIILICYVTMTGFAERTDVVLTNYRVTEDGSVLILDVQVASSMGYVRGFRDTGGGVKPHYLTFYSTFGGWNSSFGAEHSFALELGRNDTEVFFNRPDGGYELVLTRNADTGEWERPAS